MAGMLQIITYLLSFYLIVKGVEVLQIALASDRQYRRGIIILGVFTLIACIIVAVSLTYFQEMQAQSLGGQQ